MCIFCPCKILFEDTALADGEVMQGGLLRNLLAVDKMHYM